MSEVFYRPATTEVIAVYYSPLGYVYCTRCHHGAHLGSERVTQTSFGRDDACDYCGDPLNTSVEIVEGMAQVERTNARIF